MLLLLLLRVCRRYDLMREVAALWVNSRGLMDEGQAWQSVDKRQVENYVVGGAALWWRLGRPAV